MDGLQPPRDAGLRNIIDKLAEFVARNGPEFETITKQKQQGNPKFEFLYGGEYSQYYQYRVAAEQSFLKQQSSHPQGQQTQPHLNQNQQQTVNPAHFTQGQTSGMHQNHSHEMQQQTPPSNPHETFNMMHTPPPASNLMWSGSNAAPNVALQQQQPPQQHANGNSLAINMTAQIEALNVQQNKLREQLRTSEANLTAHRSVLMAQQNKEIDEAIEAAQNTQLEKLAEENGISLKEFDAILQPIIESCTKDSISSGKNWILQHSSDNAKNNVVLQYLLKKALVDGSTFQQKLHLIYLVNDILHHCVRKNVQELKNDLENVVIPMFCSADLIASNNQRVKLTRLLSLWESKAKFFDACVISKLQSPNSSMIEYKTNLQNLHHEVVSKITQATKVTLENYQQQHQVFIQYATQQITQLEQQKQQLEQQMLAAVLPNAANVIPAAHIQQQAQPQPQPHQPPRVNSGIPALMSQKIPKPTADDEIDHVQPPGVEDNSYIGASGNSSFLAGQNTSGGNNNSFTQSQQNSFGSQGDVVGINPGPPSFFIPDLSKPPPGFNSGVGGGGAYPHLGNIPSASGTGATNSGANNTSGASNTAPNISVDLMAIKAALKLIQDQHHIQQQKQHPLDGSTLQADGEQDNDEVPPPPKIYEDLSIPTTAAYYDLPAGLMVPLIRLADCTYKPLDPELIRLPAPTPQDERLTNALAAFYTPPTHDRPRDAEGWEKLGLYEYYKAKNAAKKQKEEDIQNGKREKSRSPSPIVLEKVKPKKINKRCYRSRSRSRSKSRSPIERSRSRSRSRSPQASRSRDSRSGRGSNSRHNQRNRSPQRGNGNENRDNRAERSTSNSGNMNSNGSGSNNPNSNITKRERERSLTPPSFASNNFAKPMEFIEESNKGHQMLMKMGWAGTGTGLGTKNQGINEPISSGEVRDRKDLYKGVGVNLNDPFENFRKNKGVAYVHRMRTRDEKC